MQLRQNCLFCYPVFAGIPKGRFKLNFTLQQLKEKYPLVVDFITAKDIKGKNLIGVAVKDERVLVPEDQEIIAPAEIVGLVLTRDFDSAYSIAKNMVKDKMITFEEAADKIVTIEQAIAKDSYICERRLDRISDVQKPGEEAFSKLIKELEANPDIVKISNQITTPQQEHLYLET